MQNYQLKTQYIVENFFIYAKIPHILKKYYKIFKIDNLTKVLYNVSPQIFLQCVTIK